MSLFVFISFTSTVPRPWTPSTVNRCLKNNCRPEHVLHAPSPLSSACRQWEHPRVPARHPFSRLRNLHKRKELRELVRCSVVSVWIWELIHIISALLRLFLYACGLDPLCPFFNEAILSWIKMDTTLGFFWQWCWGFLLCSNGTTKLIWKPWRADGKTGSEVQSPVPQSPAAKSYGRLSPAGSCCAKGHLVGKDDTNTSGGAMATTKAPWKQT